MTRIRAAVMRDGRLSVEEVLFVLPQGALDLEVAACGICGSDLRYLRGEDAWAKHTLGEPRALPQEMVLGHEISAWLADGDGARLVSLIPFYTCGVCWYCRTGRPNLCASTVHHGHGSHSTPEALSFGGFAERTAAFPHQIVQMPEGVTAAEATLLDGLAVALHACNNHAGVRPGASIVVIGAGPIGLSVLQAARFLGCVSSAVVDVSQNALDLALRVGADYAVQAVDTTSSDTAARLLREVPGGFDVVFDTSDTVSGQNLALNLVARGGTVTFMAGLAPGVVVTARDLAAEKRLTTSCNCLPSDYILGAQMMASGAFQARPLITHSFPLERIADAFEVAANKALTGACKVVVTSC